MSDSFKCPYCQSVFPIIHDTHSVYRPSFEGSDSGRPICLESEFSLEFWKCPQCGEYTVQMSGIGEKVETDKPVHVRPLSNAKQFPDYIPKAILEDYEEACAIVHLSPKSSATLSRRCLQGMIHDFWDIHEKNLNAELTALQPRVPAKLWKVIDGVRKIGNIGAHMESDINLIVDIDPGEAEKLIKLIEYLLEKWYIDRYDQEQLFSDIIGIAEDKESKRKSK